ncbi:uroporphyrin-III methyltransferase [Vibrio campbellii CAIM 519 = NBRC 15631 = ATCC 25920]|nr:uroporphyrin-III methyltransferase [Vibrio campbellii CAIM 519 = NBRC 15631 = ATCC 25920]ELU51899.1 Uroporphyrinogen-III methyltransferase [Vibrio campbellii CAIM 519 = NBRC 15631 = ATCC 25920]
MSTIIENGTRPEQRVLQGKLNELSSETEQAVSHALIVVGSVTQLRNKLDWFGR